MRPTLEHLAVALLPRVEFGRALAHSEWLTLVEVAEVILAGSPVEISPERVADNVEAFLIAGKSRRAWRVRALLALVDLYPLTAYKKRFRHMTRAERRRLMEERWRGGTYFWRTCGKVRNLVMLGAYGDARADAATGYVPVPLRPRFRRSEPLQKASA